jgi:hypothetical protein
MAPSSRELKRFANRSDKPLRRLSNEQERTIAPDDTAGTHCKRGYGDDGTWERFPSRGIERSDRVLAQLGRDFKDLIS